MFLLTKQTGIREKVFSCGKAQWRWGNFNGRSRLWWSLSSVKYWFCY